MTNENNETLNLPKKKSKILIPIIFLASVIVFLFAKMYIIGNNNEGYIQVVTSVSGDMYARVHPGWYLLNFGKTEQYKVAGSFIFGDSKKMPEVSDPASATGEPIEVRFYDGGIGWVSGYVRFSLPSEGDNQNNSSEITKDIEDKLIAIQKKFRGYNNLALTGIRQLVIESVQLSANMMTSEESYTTKRAELSETAWDQIMEGIYLTEQKPVTVTNKETGEIITRYRANIKRDLEGNPLRKEIPLKPFGINIAQFVLTDIEYETGVKEQISAKRKNLMDTISIRADGEKAVQERLTAEEIGKKNVVEARYKAEVEKVKQVINAEKEKNVAQIKATKEFEVSKIIAKATEFEKKAMETRAEADYQVNRMKFIADNALERKLEVLKDSCIMWAKALAEASQPIVSRITISSSGNSQNGGSVENLLKLLTVKASKELAENKD
jgi:regulator of protease activity HflC (stomatin/prohibitin superfamily)